MTRALARVLLATAVLAVASRPARAAETALERQVKAAFLYKFAGYVEWPSHAFSSAASPMTIGVVGDESLVRDLRQIVSGRTSGGRPIVVSSVDDADDVYEFRVLFVSNGASERIGKISEAAEGAATLLVTESRDAIGRGSMINFIVHEGRVRFEVDLNAVTRGGLSLSSRLLSVAQTVVAESR